MSVLERRVECIRNFPVAPKSIYIPAHVQLNIPFLKTIMLTPKHHRKTIPLRCVPRTKELSISATCRVKWFDTTIRTKLATSRNFGSDVIVRRSYVFTLQHVSHCEMSHSIACRVNFFGRVLRGNVRFLGRNLMSKGVRVSVFCSLAQKLNVKSY